MRVRLSVDNLKEFFSQAVLQLGCISKIAAQQGVSSRTIRDWRNGKNTIPLKTFKNLLKSTHLDEKKFNLTILEDFWHIKDAARKGAIVRMGLYGNPGTKEGRRRGGLKSIAVNRERNNNFIKRKIITRPKHSSKLAELTGILMGDGHLSDYQILITTNSKTDNDHALYIKKLIRDLFEIKVSVKNRKNENTVRILISSINLVKFLNKKGMPQGNKLQNKLIVPEWIFNKKSYQKAFIRGLFDTDGCVYRDVHYAKQRTYHHLSWVITSYSELLLKDLIKILTNLGFSPTHRQSQKSIYLRKQKEIDRYFENIRTHNPKHYQRYLNGRVPKWS